METDRHSHTARKQTVTDTNSTETDRHSHTNTAWQQTVTATQTQSGNRPSQPHKHRAETVTVTHTQHKNTRSKPHKHSTETVAYPDSATDAQHGNLCSKTATATRTLHARTARRNNRLAQTASHAHFIGMHTLKVDDNSGKATDITNRLCVNDNLVYHKTLHTLLIFHQVRRKQMII